MNDDAAGQGPLERPVRPVAWIGHGCQTGRQFAAMGDEPRSEACGPWIPLVTMGQAEAMVAAERERCAKLAESRPMRSGMDEWDSTAAAIRGA